MDTVLVAPERRFDNARRWQKLVRVIYSAYVTGGTLTAEVGGSTDQAQ